MMLISAVLKKGPLISDSCLMFHALSTVTVVFGLLMFDAVSTVHVMIHAVSTVVLLLG